MDIEQVTRMMRSQSWERAKGELQAMMHTFSTPENALEGQFDKLSSEVNGFIERVEDEGLAD